MALTLNQVVNRLRRLALSHKQIRSFFFGNVPDFDSGADIDYAGCFCEQQPGSIDRSGRLQTFVFRIFFLDLVKVSDDTKGNEIEVLSDMSSVAADFMAMLFDSAYEFDWTVSEQAGISPVTESLGDMVAGVSVEVGIGVDFLADRCQVPADDITFEEDFDMARTKIVTYTGTGSEGSSFTVTGLSGKTVLAAYRATDYKRIITTVPTDTDKIKVTGTDLGSYKGILSTDGTVSLQSGDALMSGEVLDFIVWSN